MLNLSKITLMHVFQLFVGLSLLISFYMLIERMYYKSYRSMNCWRFPMLLAIFLESFMI